MLIVDTGPLYAAAAKRDDDHSACKNLLANATGPLLVPQLVVTEVAYMLGDRLGPQAEIVFAQSIADGLLTVEPVLDSEWSRITELMKQYAEIRPNAMGWESHPPVETLEQGLGGLARV